MGRFVPERWTEYERKSKDAVCLSLSWKKSPQNDTGNIHPTGKIPHVRRSYTRTELWASRPLLEAKFKASDDGNGGDGDGVGGDGGDGDYSHGDDSGDDDNGSGGDCGGCNGSAADDGGDCDGGVIVM